jgi:hypothetical protein
VPLAGREADPELGPGAGVVEDQRVVAVGRVRRQDLDPAGLGVLGEGPDQIAVVAQEPIIDMFKAAIVPGVLMVLPVIPPKTNFKTPGFILRIAQKLIVFITTILETLSVGMVKSSTTRAGST